LFQSSKPLPHLLLSKISSAKSALFNMVGTGNVRTALMSVAAVCHDTTFGAYANKYMEDSAWSFTENEKLELKRDWHKLYTHCLKEIDRRFPPANMEVFQLFQVLDPSVVHGPTRRHSIGSNDLAVIFSDLLLVFEIPLHLSVSTKYTISDMKNAFTAFRTSEACADIWHAHATRSLLFDNKVVCCCNYPKWLLGPLHVCFCSSFLQVMLSLREGFLRWALYIENNDQRWVMSKCGHM
jgi:hypothetical protein